MQLSAILRLPLYVIEKNKYIDPISRFELDPVDDIDVNSYTYNKVEHLRYVLDRHGDQSAKLYARFIQIQHYFRRLTQDYDYFNHVQAKQFRLISKHLRKRTVKLRQKMLRPSDKSGKWVAPDKLLHKLKKKFIKAQFDPITVEMIECYSGGILYLINALNRTTHDVVNSRDLDEYDYINDLNIFIYWFDCIIRE